MHASILESGGGCTTSPSIPPRPAQRVRVIHSETPTLLEEAQRGRTFSRRVRYRLEPAGDRTRLTVEDEIGFLGLARLASPLAARDVQGRRRRSLERLRELAERGLTPHPRRGRGA
jgi:hypothetical protein